MLSSRIERIRDRIRTTTPTICLDRARIATEFYKTPSVAVSYTHLTLPTNREV